MDYEINVSKRQGNSENFTHYFATAEQSARDKVKAKMLYEDFKKLFPAPKFKVSVRSVQTISTSVDL